MYARWPTPLLPRQGLDVSPEGVRVNPAHSVRHPQQAPGRGDADAFIGREAGGRLVVGDEDAVELPPDGYGDCLRLGSPGAARRLRSAWAS